MTSTMICIYVVHLKAEYPTPLPAVRGRRNAIAHLPRVDRVPLGVI